ncbi:MAG: phosphate signaling complex protein PhoU [Bacteroidota bacterium]
MNHLDKELQYLRELSVEMMEIVRNQILSSKTAILNFDHGIAESILRTESRVDALELNIEKECENIIALYQPVAADLRFILSIFKSVSDIERIGDHAVFIAKNLLDRTEPFDKVLVENINMSAMFDSTIELFDDVIMAMNCQDTQIARNTFKKDKDINKSFKKSVKVLKEEISKINQASDDIILLYATEARLERTGNLLSNVAEEIIFHVEAKVLKHDKQAKKDIRAAQKD